MPKGKKAANGGLNQDRMIKLWKQGDSIREIAQATGASEVWARRVIATKDPMAYKAGLAARHSESGSATESPQGRQPRVKANGGSATTKQVIETIARAVAQAAFGDAKLVSQPMTRTEMFNSIQAGVKEGVKKIGFHTT